MLTGRLSVTLPLMSTSCATKNNCDKEQIVLKITVSYFYLTVLKCLQQDISDNLSKNLKLVIKKKKSDW